MLVLGMAAAAYQTPTVQAAERVFHRSGTDDPSTVDPHRVSLAGEQLIMLDLFMGLTTPNMHGRPMPGCAESWTISPDGKVYEFRLRQGLQWSDGVPLTAEDFVWSFRRALDPDMGYAFASRLYPIRNARAIATRKLPTSALGVFAPDPRTVRIELEGPTPYLPDVIAINAMPAPRHAIAKHGSAWIRPENFVGNGAFVLERWVPNSYVRVRKNPRFWAAERVTLDAVHHYPGDNPVTLVRRFQSGNLDLLLTVPPERADWARERFGKSLHEGRGISNEVIIFNTRRAPTSDLRVRRALSMAIDRHSIAERVIGMPGVEAFNIVPPGVLNYSNAPRFDYADTSVEVRQQEAVRLLAGAGFTAEKPLRIGLIFPANDLNRKVAVAVASMWRQIGVISDLQQKETKSLVADVGAGNFDTARFIWLAAFSDPYAFLERMLSAGSTIGVNQSRYANPGFDELLRQASQQVDLEVRADILRRAETMVLAESPVAPVYFLVGRRLVSTRVSGFIDNPRGLYPTWLMSVTPR